MNPPALQPVRVWDLPTRLFHWLLALAVIGAVATAKIGGAAMVWHFRFGYLVLGLLLWRLVWGLVGGRWSRFISFLYAPATLWRYLRGRPRGGEQLDAGHSPLGALSVWAMFIVLGVQVGTGLVADDEIANLGPLNRFVDMQTGLDATSWHRSWGETLILSLVALHVLAVLFYLVVRRRNLIRPMVGGDKPLPPGTPASADGWPQRLLALVLAAAAGLAVAWVASLAQAGF